MTIAVEGIYKKGIIKPLRDVDIEDNSKVIITIFDKRKKGSLMELAGIWRDRKDIDKRFKEILKDRESFELREAG